MNKLIPILIEYKVKSFGDFKFSKQDIANLKEAEIWGKNMNEWNIDKIKNVNGK